MSYPYRTTPCIIVTRTIIDVHYLPVAQWAVWRNRHFCEHAFDGSALVTHKKCSTLLEVIGSCIINSCCSCSCISCCLMFSATNRRGIFQEGRGDNVCQV